MHLNNITGKDALRCSKLPKKKKKNNYNLILKAIQFSLNESLNPIQEARGPVGMGPISPSL